MILIKTGETFPFAVDMFNEDGTVMDLTDGVAQFKMYNGTEVLLTDDCQIVGSTVYYLLGSADTVDSGDNYFEIRLWIGANFAKEIATGGISISKTEIVDKPVIVP